MQKELSKDQTVLVSTRVFAGEAHRFVGFECEWSEIHNMLLKVSQHEHSNGCPVDNDLQILQASMYISDIDEFHLALESSKLQSWLEQNSVELIWQKPASGADISIRLWQTSGTKENRNNADGINQVSQRFLSWVFHSPAPKYNNAETIEKSFSTSWALSSESLKTLGFAAGNIIRTWIYIEDINGISNHEENYQKVNLIRKSLFTKYEPQINEFWNGYPSSTGIGQYFGSLGMSILACKPMGDYFIAPIENDKQISAYYYPTIESKIPPLFSRAITIKNQSEAIVFVSGTASILKSGSVHLNDAKSQTEQTLTNISTLLESKALQFESKLTLGLETVVSCVVYIKKQKDYSIIKSVCKARLPPTAVVTYTLADICRPELLVEIEAVSFTG